jgi:YVTN family beta-propeller protein
MHMHTRRLLLGGAAFLLAVAPMSQTADASPLQTYSFAATSFVQDPTGTWIYAADPAANAVQVINAGTLQVAHTINVGSTPNTLALSADGSILYVGNGGSTEISRVNTSTLALLTPLTAPGGPATSLQVGTSNRLWVLSGGAIRQIDATTGASTGANLSQTEGMYPLLVNGGEIQVTSDGKTLFYGNTGFSPSNAYVYDVSGATAVEQHAYSTGGNGRTLAASPDGNRFAYASAGDDFGHVPVFSASTGTQLGFLSNPATDVTFSPNNLAVFGTFTYVRHVDQYDGVTYQLVGTGIDLPADGQVLFADSSGTHLFVGEADRTEVYAVVTPEPATAALAGIPLVGLLLRRRRRQGLN